MAVMIGKEKNLEAIFMATFSALTIAFFYSLLSSNGLVLGNDPAVHLHTAAYYLNVGRIPLGDIAWYTPLYHVILDTFIVFTGASGIEQTMTLMKIFTAVVNWLLIFSVYLVTAKFFDKKTGILAASLLLLCFPLLELNSWGGYTSILSIAFMMLTILYLATPQKGAGNALVAFIFAFSIVLSHQLATFVGVFILPPFILAVLIKGRGKNSKALIAVLLGGAIAFLIYYVRPILPYLGELISIVFVQIKVYVYQIPLVNFDSFMLNFGFLLFFAFAGLAIAFIKLRRQKSLSFYMLLFLALFVPLAFSQSYLAGIFLPFQRFIYFLLPPLAILAAVTLSYLIDLAFASYFNNKTGWKRNALKIISVAIVIALTAVMVVRFQTVTNKLGETVVYYSSSDVNSFQIGNFIRQEFPDPQTIGVVTEKPGHWLAEYTNKPLIIQTSQYVDLSFNANSVLDLSYEIMQPLTTMKVYEAKNVSEESFFIINMIWMRATFMPLKESYVNYFDPNGSLLSFPLSTLERKVSMDKVNYPKSIKVTYSCKEFVLTENIQVENNTYPITETWQLMALGKDLNYPILYLSEYFEPTYVYTKANVPGMLNWENPLSNPSKGEAGVWGLTYFSRQNLTDNKCVDVYAEENQTAFALKFLDLPEWGLVGALANGRIDQVRWQYNFQVIPVNQTVSVSYQKLSFSMDSYPALKDPKNMDTLFDLKVTEAFEVRCRDFASIIRDNHIGFVVCDISRFDPRILSSKWVNLIYANEKYVVLMTKNNHPTADVLENTG